ncbi:MAG TPA: ATP-binding protein, partial [Gammaproteobacteria bacterium]|nr:ATP-binding protein [Gammaproteobacteria bacterium]
MKGRTSELRTLVRTIAATRPTRIAMVGPGGSGKSMLAAALGHRLRTEFGGRIDWFRTGAWGFYTLSEMLALRFGTGRGEGRVQRLQQFLSGGPQRLIVLDNHEDDRAIARLFEAFEGSNATFVITARRCLLAGVLIFPVMAPLVTSGESPFPRVAGLTRLLRWNPLALDIADSIVATDATSVKALGEFLQDAGVAQVRALEHEDDLPEIALLIEWAWPRLSAEARRALAVLAHVEGDHVDALSLAELSG